jgi:hypothetical protein
MFENNSLFNIFLTEYWATLGYLGLPWATLAILGYLGHTLGILGTLGFLNTYTGCSINIVPLPEHLYWVESLNQGKEAGEQHPVFCARTFPGLHSVQL